MLLPHVLFISKPAFLGRPLLIWLKQAGFTHQAWPWAPQGAGEACPAAHPADETPFA